MPSPKEDGKGKRRFRLQILSTNSLRLCQVRVETDAVSRYSSLPVSAGVDGGVRALHPKHRRTHAKHFGLCKFQAMHSLIFMASASSCRTERMVPNNVAMLCKLSNLLIMQLLLLSCVCILHSLHAQCVTASGLFWIRWWQATIQTFQEIITLSGQNRMSSDCCIWICTKYQKPSASFSTQILGVSMPWLSWQLQRQQLLVLPSWLPPHVRRIILPGPTNFLN
jgi:hypothetical protein